jgi:hypothetical protein
VLEDERFPKLPATLIEGVEAFAADEPLREAMGACSHARSSGSSATTGAGS